MEHRINEWHNAWGALKSVLCNIGLVVNTNNWQYDRLILPTALYRAEAWVMRSAKRRKVNILEMN